MKRGAEEMLKGWELQWWQGKINYSSTRDACWHAKPGESIFSDIVIPATPPKREEHENTQKKAEVMDIDG